MNKKEFYQNIKKVAVPITVQSLLQAALSLIDQIMIGNLGSANIAGVGLAAKFISLFTVTMTAIVTVAGIMIAQYKGNKSKDGINNSFFCNLYFALIVAVIFILLSLVVPKQIMGLYSKDYATIAPAAIYLRIMAVGFIPQTITLMMSALLRNMESAKSATIASGISVVTNTVLNYFFIFGVGIFPKMNVAGAALATSVSRIIELVIIMGFFIKARREKGIELKCVFSFEKDFVKKIGYVLAPILLCEFLWSLGENVYAIIYGHIGTEACAAMTLTYPIQTLAIGALSGVSASAGIIIGESLGAGKNEKAYEESVSFVKITVLAAIVIGIIVSVLAGYYVKLYNVSDETRNITIYILYAYSLVFCGKVVNMVLGGGVLRSGGQTKYIMIIDMIGTWVIGVPLGIVTAYVLKLPIYYVYFILSLEEYVRFLLEIYVFKSKRWMKNIAEQV
ncbi:MAG: MATE family efflux transporter [Lachnospiraceae bacterium]|nr:MATE family efflux transporter [Lachnospiraceae bacterium]